VLIYIIVFHEFVRPFGISSWDFPAEGGPDILSMHEIIEYNAGSADAADGTPPLHVNNGYP
jgi:hypothetical protein